MDDHTLWESMYFDLREQIESGILQPDSKMPTEPELQDTYDVSRQTVRAALTRLQRDGLVSAGQGKRGRRVMNMRRLRWQLSEFEHGDRNDSPTTGVDDWAAGVESQGRHPRQEVRVSSEAAPADIARDLEIKPGDQVAVRRRMRYVDGIPYQISVSWFPMSIAEGTRLMDEGDITMKGGILRNIGHPQLSVTDTIIIRMPSSHEAQSLHITTSSPVGEHRRIGYGEDGTPVRLMVTVFPGDRHELVYDLELT